MRSRSRRAEVSAAWACAFAGLLVVMSSWMCGSARAELSGEVDGRALLGLDGRKGGALSVDLWGTRGMFRPGAAFGLGALSSNRHGSSRVFTPLSLSLGFVPWGDERTGLVLVVRGGGYAGAQKGGLIAGAFASGSIGLGIALGEGASLRIAGEAWGLIGQHGGAFFGPTVGLGF